MRAEVRRRTGTDDERSRGDDGTLSSSAVQDADAGSGRAGSKAGHDLGGFFVGLPRPVSDPPCADESILDMTTYVVCGECVKGV